MDADPFALIVARRELVDAGHQYLDALRRYWNATSRGHRARARRRRSTRPSRAAHRAPPTATRRHWRTPCRSRAARSSAPALAAGAALVAKRHAHAQPAHRRSQPHRRRRHRAAGARPARRVVVPNGSLLPWTIRGGVKIFHLRAEPVKHQIAPGLEIEAWGYNGSTPGPRDRGGRGRSRAHLRHEQAARADDACTGTACSCRTAWTASPASRRRRSSPARRSATSSRSIAPGTFMYHPHFDEMTQIALGMMGMIVVHPRGAAARAASATTR